MKKTILSLALALVATAAAAQADSVQVYRFTYEYCDSNVYAKRNYPDIMHLDIRPDGASEFYSRYGRSASQFNVINVTSMTATERQAHMEKMKKAKKGVEYNILKNFPESGKMTVTDKVAISELYYTEDLPQPEWRFADGEREICGYLCKRAEADFFGRRWTAWYAEDLPLNNGPWKLGFLPGLILEACDADNFFHFTCVGIEATNAMPTTKIDKNLVKCSHKELDRMEREYYADQMAFFLNQMQGEGRVISIRDEKGNDIKSSPKENRIYIEKAADDER